MFRDCLVWPSLLVYVFILASPSTMTKVLRWIPYLLVFDFQLPLVGDLPLLETRQKLPLAPLTHKAGDVEPASDTVLAGAGVAGD